MLIQERILDSRDIRRQKDAKYIVSYGGGINSTALILFLVKNKFPLDCVVFSDTGDEMPETYKYLGIMEGYLKRRNIPFEIVTNRKKETLSDKCLRREVVPSQVWRWCTRDFKVIPIHAFYRKLKSHVYQYMGIDYGEVRRMKPAKEDYVKGILPSANRQDDQEEKEVAIGQSRQSMRQRMYDLKLV